MNISPRPASALLPLTVGLLVVEATASSRASRDEELGPRPRSDALCSAFILLCCRPASLGQRHRGPARPACNEPRRAPGSVAQKETCGDAVGISTNCLQSRIVSAHDSQMFRRKSGSTQNCAFGGSDCAFRIYILCKSIPDSDLSQHRVQRVPPIEFVALVGGGTMSGPAQDEALPQRQPRKKRARLVVEAEQSAAGVGDPAGLEAVPAAGGAPPELPASAHPTPACPGSDSGADKPALGPDAGGVPDSPPHHAQLELQEYRSAAVGNYSFECERLGPVQRPAQLVRPGFDSQHCCLPTPCASFALADLDHTADVQLHAWGSTLEQAFESVGLCMFNYMTPLKGIAVMEGEAGVRQYEAKGHDLSSLLFHWLDELLFSFCTDFFVPKQLRITAFDRENWHLEAEGCVSAGALFPC